MGTETISLDDLKDQFEDLKSQLASLKKAAPENKLSMIV